MDSKRRFPGLRPGRDAGIAASLALGYLALYVRTLCPTVYLGDSGEIAAAIASGGVVHPPGYPLYSLLGRAALVLVPVGEAAFRVGCVTALAAALAVAVLYGVAREAGASRWAAALGAAVFGGSFTFWNQSTRVEVYSLHVLLAGLALLGALRYRRSGRARDLALGMLAGSLGLGHHLTIALLAPAAAVLCGSRLWREPGLARRLALLLGLAPLGPALYLLLLLWARAEPLHNWGRPVTLDLLWRHASAAVYQGNLQLPDAAHLARTLPLLWSMLCDNFPVGLPLLGVAGVWSAARRSPGTALGVGLVPAVVVPFSLCYRIGDVAPYLLPAWAATAVLVSLGLDAAREWGERMRGEGDSPREGLPAAMPAITTAAVTVGLLLAPVLQNWRACDLSRATWVREFGRHKLESADPNAVLVCQWDPDVFPLWYVQDVLGVRKDVLVLDRFGLRNAYLNQQRDPSNWYLHQLRGQGVPVDSQAARGLVSAMLLGDDGALLRLAARRTPQAWRARPWCMTFGLSDHPFDGDSQLFMRWIGRARTAVPQGLVLRLYRRGEVVSDAEALRKSAAIWRTVRLPDPAAVRMDQDLLPDLVVGHYTWMLVNFGQLQERAGRYAEAEATYTQALELAPDPEGAGGQAAAALQALRRRGVNGSVRLDTGGSGQNGSPAGLSTAQTTLARQAAQ